VSDENTRGLTFHELMNLGIVDHPSPGVVSRVTEVARLIGQGKSPDEAMRLTEPEPVWNTKIAVIMNLRAEDADAAITKLAEALWRAGFEPMTDCGPDYADAFESEDGVTVDDPDNLPARRR
jgi:hypothetical protein